MSASSSYLVRAIYKEHTASQTDWSGSYELLVKAKTMPTPVGAPNNIEATTLEDSSQTYVKGIQTSDSQEITGNLEKEYLQGINALGDKEVDIMYLYGTDGLGGVAKYVRTAQVIASPSDVSVDSVLEMAVTVIPTSSAEEVTDGYTVTFSSSTGKFTVTKKSGS